MKACPICTSEMEMCFEQDRYSNFSSSAEQYLGGGTIPLASNCQAMPLDSNIYVRHWKCPNCGNCISEKITKNAGSR